MIDAGAKPNLEDLEGNTPLHVKCYGETGQPSELGAIQLLLDNGAKLTARNNRVMIFFFEQKYFTPQNSLGSFSSKRFNILYKGDKA